MEKMHHHCDEFVTPSVKNFKFETKHNGNAIIQFQHILHSYFITFWLFDQEPLSGTVSTRGLKSENIRITGSRKKVCHFHTVMTGDSLPNLCLVRFIFLLYSTVYTIVLIHNSFQIWMMELSTSSTILVCSCTLKNYYPISNSSALALEVF